MREGSEVSRGGEVSSQCDVYKIPKSKKEHVSIITYIWSHALVSVTCPQGKAEIHMHHVAMLYVLFDKYNSFIQNSDD